MLGGYTGRLLRIDLSCGEARDEVLEEKVLKKYLGGSGLAAKILYNETGADTNPLSPENRLIFMIGPMTNTPVPTSSRYSVVSVSPKTGILGESNSSGFWGPELKQTGYDGIVIEGKSPAPVYIWIDNGKLSIRDASHLGGKDTHETDKMVRAKTHEQAKVACIGIAGEKLIHSACIVNDVRDARVAGRTGMGAVMGSKNLKAIAVYGTKKMQLNDIHLPADSQR